MRYLRSFQYDSLSRLKQATNPESGTIQYSYDANSNLQTKTDARGVVTTYAYDALNRVKTRQYTNEPSGSETPDVSHYYDLVTNAKGKLIKVTSSVSTTEYTGFDTLGRVISHKQTTDGTAYTTAYEYNLAGALIEETYPFGRVVRDTLDPNGELAAVLGSEPSHPQFWAYANNFKYSAAGAVTATQLGNGLWESTAFNERLRPTQIALGTTQNATNLLDLDDTYGTTQNNGNVLSQTITVPTVGTTPGFTAVQNYSYDQLNRLKDATEAVSGATDLEAGLQLRPGSATETSSDQVGAVGTTAGFTAVQNYDYDALNRSQIASETLTPTSGIAETWTQEFKYDRYGNRNFNEATTTTLPKNCGTAPNLTVCATDVPKVNPSIDPSNNRLNSAGYSFDAAGNTTGDAKNRKFTYSSSSAWFSRRQR